MPLPLLTAELLLGQPEPAQPRGSRGMPRLSPAERLTVTPEHAPPPRLSRCRWGLCPPRRAGRPLQHPRANPGLASTAAEPQVSSFLEPKLLRFPEMLHKHPAPQQPGRGRPLLHAPDVPPGHGKPRWPPAAGSKRPAGAAAAPAAACESRGPRCWQGAAPGSGSGSGAGTGTPDSSQTHPASPASPWAKVRQE